ncbi:MAG: cyclic nucleotide-binding domain-containing protein [Deltaproteobacteria bacterium]|nr:cyclic nucleotide-binding domain-containing protein [Deltaproteobacteria bacterium]
MSDTQVVIRGLGHGNEDRLMPASQVIAGLVKLLGEDRVDDAAKVYSRCSVDVGFQLTQKISGDRKLEKAAAAMLYRARDYAKAALVCESLEDFEKAAALYEKADDPYLAAEMYVRCGNRARAAVMYERAGNLEQAAGLYVEAEEFEQAAECFRRVGKNFRAGQLLEKLGKDRLALELLQKVEEDHPDFNEAITLLAELLGRNGYAQLAEKKLLSFLEGKSVDASTVDLHYALADLYARTGKTERAKEVFGEILQFDINYRDAAARLKRCEEGEEEDDALPEVEVELDEELEAEDVVGMDDALAQFRELPLFEDLSLDDVRALAEIAHVREFQPGQVLIEQGAHGEALYVVTKGRVEVKRTDASAEKLLAVLPAGAHVGEMSLIDDAPTSARVIAAEEVEALVLPVDAFRRLLDTRPALSLRIHIVLATTLCRRLRATDAKLRN